MENLFKKLHREFKDMLKLMQHWTFSNKIKKPESKSKKESKKSDKKDDPPDKKRGVRSDGEEVNPEIDSRNRISRLPIPIPQLRETNNSSVSRRRIIGGRRPVFFNTPRPISNSGFLDMLGRHRSFLNRGNSRNNSNSLVSGLPVTAYWRSRYPDGHSNDSNENNQQNRRNQDVVNQNGETAQPIQEERNALENQNNNQGQETQNTQGNQEIEEEREDNRERGRDTQNRINRRRVIRSRSLGTNSLTSSANRQRRPTSSSLNNTRNNISRVLNQISNIISNQNNELNNIQNVNNRINNNNTQSTGPPPIINQNTDTNNQVNNPTINNQNQQNQQNPLSQNENPQNQINNTNQGLNDSESQNQSQAFRLSRISLNHTGIVRMNAGPESVTETNTNPNMNRSDPNMVNSLIVPGTRPPLIRNHFSFEEARNRQRETQNQNSNSNNTNNQSTTNQFPNIESIRIIYPQNNSNNQSEGERVNLPIRNFENLRERVMANNYGREVTRGFLNPDGTRNNRFSEFRDSIIDLENEVRNLENAFIDIRNNMNRQDNQNSQNTLLPITRDSNVENRNQNENNTNIQPNENQQQNVLTQETEQPNINTSHPMNIENSYNPPTQNQQNTNTNQEPNQSSNISNNQTINLRLDQNSPLITLPQSRTDPRSNPDPNPDPNPNTITNTTPNPEIIAGHLNNEGGTGANDNRIQEENNIRNAGVSTGAGPAIINANRRNRPEQGIRRRNGYMTYFDGDIPEELRLFFMNLGNSRLNRDSNFSKREDIHFKNFLKQSIKK